jgi:hypothetical protein
MLTVVLRLSSLFFFLLYKNLFVQYCAFLRLVLFVSSLVATVHNLFESVKVTHVHRNLVTWKQFQFF